MIVLKIVYMIIDYTITNKMISSVTSISEKIGRIKEIRSANKHINFDLQCNIKNIQNILYSLEVPYSNQFITQLITDNSLSINPHKEEELAIAQNIIEFYKRIIKNSDLEIENLAKEYNSTGLFENIDVDHIQNIIEKYKVSNLSNFFLYNIAKFCCESYYKVNGIFEELWLILSFYKEYGFVLHLSYDKYFEQEKFIDYNNVNHFDNADLLSREHNSKYPLYEFYLSVIDSILEESIELHYKLIHPVSDRVEILKGVIKEPFSRKDYMEYHKIASATASLDLKKAVEKGILTIEGDKRNARYCFKDETDVVFL